MDKNNKNKRNLKDYGELKSKRVRFIYNDDDDIFDELTSPNNDFFISSEDSEDDKELVIINTTPINNLIDLIELGKFYDKTKRYNIDMKIFCNIILLNKIFSQLYVLHVCVRDKVKGIKLPFFM